MLWLASFKFHKLINHLPGLFLFYFFRKRSVSFCYIVNRVSNELVRSIQESTAQSRFFSQYQIFIDVLEMLRLIEQVWKRLVTTSNKSDGTIGTVQTRLISKKYNKMI